MSLIFVLFVILLCNFIDKSEEKKQMIEEQSPGNNVGLQYIYTIDEWYKLRLEFDEAIEKDWNIYSKGGMKKEKYKEKCILAVKKIIGEDYPNFKTLYEYGVRNAAIRVAREGYNPGETRAKAFCKRKLKTWEPISYRTGYLSPADHWSRCIPGNGNFLTMYPDPWELEYMHCGIMENGKWIGEHVEDHSFGGSHFTFPDSDKKRFSVIDYLVSRGYDGESYTKEPKRSFEKLSQMQISKKYEFVVKDPGTNYEKIEKSAKCNSGAKKKWVYGIFEE